MPALLKVLGLSISIILGILAKVNKCIYGTFEFTSSSLTLTLTLMLFFCLGISCLWPVYHINLYDHIPYKFLVFPIAYGLAHTNTYSRCSNRPVDLSWHGQEVPLDDSATVRQAILGSAAFLPAPEKIQDGLRVLG